MSPRRTVPSKNSSQAGPIASWIEAHALLPVGRRLGTRHGQPRADVPLYWLNRALGMVVGVDTTRRVRVDGYKMALPLSDAGLRLSYLIGHYELDVERLAAATLRPGDIAVDVGANIGWHTLRFASAVGPCGHVFSFEPSEAPRALLAESTRLNDWTGRITVRGDAVSDQIGTTALYLDGAAGLMSAIRPHEWLETSHPAMVPVTTLDAGLLPHLDRAPRMLKIDVEGAEHEVLRGAARLFRDMPPAFVILEISSILDSTPVLDLMTTYDYEAVTLTQEGLRPTSLERPPSVAPIGEASFEYRNVCFCHRALTAAGALADGSA